MKKLPIFIVLLCSLALPAEAALGFGSTYGAGSTDGVKETTSITEGPNVTFSEWFVFHGAGGSNFGILFTDNANVTALVPAGVATSLEFQQHFSGSLGNGQWTFPVSTSTSWQHVCLVYNNSATTNNPIVYLNGSTASVTTVNVPIGTAVTNWTSYTNGNVDAHNQAWDGKLADFAMWNAQLTANECKALSRGASPLKIRKANLLVYNPLNGFQSGEMDWATRNALTVTATAKVNQPPLQGFPFGSVR